MSVSNPWDVSDIILQNRAGQLWGQGIANFGQAAGQAIMQYADIKKQNKAMQGEINANTDFFEKAKDIAKDDPAKVAQLDATLKGMHDNTKSLSERFAYANTAKKNFIDTYTLGEMAQKQKLIAQDIAERARAQGIQSQQDQYLAAAAAGKNAPFVANNAAYAAAQDPAAQLALRARMTGLSPQDLMLFSTGGLKGNVQEHTTSTGAKYVVNPATGAFQFVPLTAEQQAAIEGQKAEAELNAKNNAEFLGSISDAAEASRNKLASIGRIRQLYQSGATTGFGQSYLTEGKNFLSRLGVDIKGIGDQQALEKELGAYGLEATREFMKGTGSVSNYEQKLVQGATVNKELNMGAVLNILGVAEQIGQRNIKLEALRQDLEDKGVPKNEIARQLSRARANMPLVGLETLAQPSSMPTVVPSPGTTADDILKKHGL